MTRACLHDISRQLSKEVSGLSFSPPVTHVYNPLEYARAPHEAYLERYGNAPKRVLLLGMNPGPFGMAQTGVPFGDAAMVQGWLGISGRVGKPCDLHPKRPVLGFDCPRREVSGSRLWGWARDVFGTPGCFFGQCFVANYCPLVFMDLAGRNHTPDRLPADERRDLYRACDRALRRVVGLLEPASVVGVGNFAAERAREALGERGLQVLCLTHPSPANPRAHHGWADEATRCVQQCGVELPRSLPR
ncbi:MAG: single-stranded DNA-binding protein [Polyangiaceae bacterium]|nr:single-stranded DNA-binding protein [Polyangiaceae bacterium]